MSDETRMFRPSTFAIWLWASVFGVTLALLGALAIVAVVAPIADEAPPWSSLLVTVPVALVVGAGLAAAYARAFPVLLDSSKVTGNDAWGRRRSLEWADASAVQVRNVAGLRFLVVSGSAAPSLWIPLFLRDRAGFLTAIRELVPAEHPVVCGLDGLT